MAAQLLIAHRRIWKYRLLALCLLAIATAETTTATRRERSIEAWKPLHYSVEITLDEQLTQIRSARTEITIISLKDQLSVIDLDFGNLQIDSVNANDRNLTYDRKDPGLLISLERPLNRDSRLVLSVTYHGKPADGLVLAKDKDGKQSVVGDNWPNRVHHWIPCFDHPAAKATVNFVINAPTKYLAVANGKLEGVRSRSAGQLTWSYSEGIPIPPYCMIIAVGDFARIDPFEASVTPLTYYVPQSDSRFAAKGFSSAAPSLKFFSETVAPYPYEKLALIVGATQFGGMENSSAIVFSSNLFTPRDEKLSRTYGIRMGIVDVVAHEIAHQWFGDSVTESTWSDLWLSEGFATYFAGLFIERFEGQKAFQDYMNEAAETYFAYAKRSRTPLFDDQTEDLFKLLNANNYQKAAWILHMLRMRLGEKAFLNGLRSYYAAHKDGVANSDDLRRALEESGKTDLREFFDRWVYGSGHPEYELEWNWEATKKRAKFILKQIQPEPAFKEFLPIDLISQTGVQRIVLKPESRVTTLELPFHHPPVALKVDPENTLLKQIRVTNRQ